MKKSLRIDFYVTLGIILSSVFLIVNFHFRPLTSALFLFVLPTIYLFFRKKKPIKEVFAGSVLIGAGLEFIFNIIASANNAWNEISSQLVFNYRIFGFWPIDEPIWFFLLTIFVITFYEHFFEKDRNDKLSKKFLYIFIPVFISLVIISIFASINQNFLLFKYAYFLTCLPMLIPIIYVIKNRPKLILKFLKTSIFFFMLYFVYEVIAVQSGQWYFPGLYIGWIDLGGIKFPFEELLYWMGLSTFTILSIYEGFVDNGK